MITGHSYPVPGFSAPVARGLSAQKFGLFLVWLTMASSSIVFAEPAPFDALMIGLIALLPLLGLTLFSIPILFLLFALLVIGASELISSTFSSLIDVSTKHTLISIYLSLSAVILAAFVRADIERHSRLVMSGLLFASVAATLAGMVGYFGFIPGLEELFTEYGRARGPFKDPNVFGSFIVPALIFYMHGVMSASARKSLIMFMFAGLIALGLLISYSLPRPDHISIEIRDITGKLLYQSAREASGKETVEIIWSGMPEGSLAASGGIFLLSLRTSTQVLVMKIVKQ